MQGADMMSYVKMESGIERYQYIIDNLRNTNVRENKVFQTKFKGFYFTAPKRAEWYDAYFSMFEDYKAIKPTFEELLRNFADIMGSCEASFISKMLNAIDDSQVIIDRKTLEYYGLGLKRDGSLESKIKHALKVYAILTEKMNETLNADKVKEAIKTFNSYYPNNYSDLRKLDFLIIYGVIS